jgi:hypothetical protein
MTVTVGKGSPETGADAVALKVGALFSKLLHLNIQSKIDRVTASASPHRVFHCGLEEASRDVLEEATFAGWRYLVLQEEQAVVEATLGGNGRVVSAAASAALKMERQDLQWLVVQPELQVDDFELCYLRVASGVLRAWWLVSATGNRQKDILLPVLPSHPTLRGTERVWLWGDEVRRKVAEIAGEKLDQGRILVRGVPGLGG